MILPATQLRLLEPLQRAAVRVGLPGLAERLRRRAFRCRLALTPVSVVDGIFAERHAESVRAMRAEDAFDLGEDADCMDDGDEDEVVHG